MHLVVQGFLAVETGAVTGIGADIDRLESGWSPGWSGSFLIRVSNRSVATLYQPYVLKLWANKLDSDGAPTAWTVVSSGNYNGIQGNSTSIQILNFKPKSSGNYRLLITLEKGSVYGNF